MKKDKKQNIAEEDKKCKCNGECTCGDNCTCDEEHKCSENCTCGDECHCGDSCDCGHEHEEENEIKFDAENDLNVAIIKNNKDLLLNENCCTCINIMLSNDGRILTSFLGCHNPYIVNQLEKIACVTNDTGDFLYGVFVLLLQLVKFFHQFRKDIFSFRCTVDIPDLERIFFQIV